MDATAVGTHRLQTMETPPLDYRRLFEASPGLYALLRPDLTIAAASDAYLRATMTRREDILDRPLFEVFPENPDQPGPSAMLNASASLERVLRTGLPDVLPTQRYDIRRPDGTFEQRYWTIRNAPVLGDDGKVSVILHIADDITDSVRRREAEIEHERRNEELRVRAGKMAAEIYLRAQQVEDANRRLRQLNDELTASAQSEREAHLALRRTQSFLVQNEKLAGLGQMVAGVAHEINNPLAFVINNLAVAQRDVEAIASLVALYRTADADIASAQPELAARIAEQAARIDLDYTLGNLTPLFARSRDGLKRIQQIVKDLRTFARLDESDLHEVDLNPGIESTANIIRGRARKKDVEIVLELTPIPTIACYPGKVNQVVMNLLSNAVDASAHGAKVLVRTAPADDGGAVIEVIDTGTGVDPSIVDRIFDPFFTTKPQGEGTGLGLSISYGIVQEHGGSIEVTPTPGGGSTFTVRLPPRPPPRERVSYERIA
jgi:signal transduction histidine kinase